MLIYACFTSFDSSLCRGVYDAGVSHLVDGEGLVWRVYMAVHTLMLVLFTVGSMYI